MKAKNLLSLAGSLALIAMVSCSKDETKPKPIAGFTASKTTAFVAEEIQFTNTSENATAYNWSFGDGTTSTLESPAKTYDIAGTFTVTLVATGAGGSDVKTMDITIEEEVFVPTAAFTPSVTSTAVGSDITFVNNSTHATTYAWDFGDETTSTEVSPVKSYAAEGNYTVTLIATGEGGADTATQVITAIVSSSHLLYFMDSSDELMEKLSLDGTSTITTVKDLAGMAGVGIAYDDANEKIYFSDFNDADTPNGKIWRMNLDGTGAEAIVDSLLDPYGIALDLTNGKVYWVDDAGNVSRANLDGTSQEVLVNIPDGWNRAIALDVPNNKMYFYEVDFEILYVADLDGSNLAPLIEGVYGYGIYLDLVNEKIYFDDQNTPGLRRANMDGTSVEAIDDIDTRIYGMTIYNDKLYWSARDAGEIYRANLDGTNKVTLATGLSSPRGLFLKLNMK